MSLTTPTTATDRATTTQQITRTIRLKLETSARKSSRVRDVVDEWQAMAARFADLMPTIPHDRWGDVNETWQKDLALGEFPTEELSVRAHERNQALYKVSEAFGSWRENGQRGRRPSFGDKPFARFCHCGISVDMNDRGYALKMKLQPYKPEWFHIDCGEYQREWLDAVVDGEADTGSAELHLDGGDLFAHVTVKTEVEIFEPESVDRWLGIDLGENVLYAAAVVSDDGTVEDVEVRSGREFRHYRERLDREREAAMRDGDVAEITAQRRRYTNHVTHTASREIVRLAERHRPIGIRFEDLTGYRESATDPIHDWPQHELREKIAYKATEVGIPVDTPVDPKNTSITCRKCGNRNPAMRDGVEFECWECGYEVHADVNAAINIATGAFD